MVAYADNSALLVAGKDEVSLQLACEESVERMCLWFSDAGLELAAEKTEANFFTRKRELVPPRIMIDGHVVAYSRSIRYLRVQLDERLRFIRHTEVVSAKAARVAEDLARLMLNISGPRTSRRKLYHSVVHSVLLYAAPVWADSLAVKKARLNLARFQRKSALRVAAAYRTVSEEAALVLAATPPIGLLALERKAVYFGQGPMTTARSAAKERTMDAWQCRWDNARKGRWTHQLIEDLRGWYGRGHGEHDS